MQRIKTEPVAKSTFDNLTFTNRFTRNLPADPSDENRPRQVMGACYSRVAPQQTAAPKLIAYSQEVADLLDLDLETIQSDQFTQVFSGNQVLDDMDPFAYCYGGHQFGNWAGQLGDGRAINLGEIVNQRGKHWMLQLKGAGPTPYSRSGDGFAVLRSSIREFLCSEAMHHLGVPTTRALSLALTGNRVMRDMFYNGNAQYERGAIVCRVAQSFTRFGNFEIFASRKELDVLEQLVDYTIRSDFPHLIAQDKPINDDNRSALIVAMFTEVCQRTAEMIVHWMRVGFVHGVMNTDNMSILGQTIDYGPYGWLEDYDPTWTPNTTDAGQRRYRYGNQPQIAHWNLAQLGNALVPLLDDVEPLQNALDAYSQTFVDGWQTMMAHKLGLDEFDPQMDKELVNELQEVLQLAETDMTIFYRKLADLNLSDENQDDNALIDPIRNAYYVADQLTEEVNARVARWLRTYSQRLQKDGTPHPLRRERMNSVNPKYVLRNYMAQLAIDQAEQGDYALVNDLLELLRNPYDEQSEHEKWAAKRPDWARQRAGCSMLSCSS